MTPLEHRGRTLFIAIIAIGTLTMLGAGLLGGMPSAPGRVLALYGRPLLIVLLGVLAAHGRRWARRMLIVFFVFAAFVVAIVPMVSSAPGGPLTVFLALGAMYVACAVLLARSAAIRAFLQRPMPGAPGTQAPPP